jgi:hypothetical protein
MIFKREDSYHRKRRKDHQKAALGWHSWFAWHIVKLEEEAEEGMITYAWLTKVERRFIAVDGWFDDSFTYFEYRRISSA